MGYYAHCKHCDKEIPNPKSHDFIIGYISCPSCKIPFNLSDKDNTKMLINTVGRVSQLESESAVYISEINSLTVRLDKIEEAININNKYQQPVSDRHKLNAARSTIRKLIGIIDRLTFTGVDGIPVNAMKGDVDLTRILEPELALANNFLKYS